MLRSWYISADLYIEITTWEELTVCFAHTFYLVDTNLDVHNMLQLIRDVVLNIVPTVYPMNPHAHCHMQSMMECYNVSSGPKDNDELWNINIPETEGSMYVASPDIMTNPMNQPLNIRKVNIGTEENPKFVSVEDY